MGLGIIPLPCNVSKLLYTWAAILGGGWVEGHFEETLKKEEQFFRV